ncbi:nickel-dependent lactate racemase [Sporomusaceae bacterium BoRhaA]|uniref:nickel-dependent lactate racemase n=1 Tax=Pelorhabdus rhamnosifermentans TaxID=2772457 RepID=UPI001C060F70|nr:nickel-dependent lactate racemase [Pelorhabdus rhamnosifermentans]MBU2700534.1 nickel-dependent lactate racemase [Pelorhabdus rhamnosifermentans]
MAKFELGFGQKNISFEIPDNQLIATVEGRDYPAAKDMEEAFKEAIEHPIGTLPLKEIIAADDTVAIVVSDVTRAWIHYEQFLPLLLNALNDFGVPDEKIFLMVALGAHRKHSAEEQVNVYGEEVVRRVAIYQNDAFNAEEFVYQGTTSHGVKAYQNKRVVNADKVILTGGIVYHLMAGFGAGRKSVMPGISGYETIQGNHALCLNKIVGQGLNPECYNGNTQSDMAQDMMEMADMLQPAFLLNVVMNAEGKVAKFVGGHYEKAWREGCQTVEAIFGVPVAEKADLVIASSGGYPKDINLYQATKSTENAVMACKEGGVIIALLECRNIGEPPDFSDWFQYKSLYEREMVLRKGFTVPGFIALKMGFSAKRMTHIIVSLPKNREFIENAGLVFAASFEEALTLAEERLGKDYKVTVMPHAANTMPVIQA